MTTPQNKSGCRGSESRIDSPFSMCVLLFVFVEQKVDSSSRLHAPSLRELRARHAVGSFRGYFWPPGSWNLRVRLDTSAVDRDGPPAVGRRSKVLDEVLCAWDPTARWTRSAYVCSNEEGNGVVEADEIATRTTGAQTLEEAIFTASFTSQPTFSPNVGERMTAEWSGAALVIQGCRSAWFHPGRCA